MDTNDERMIILKMVEEGKITAQDAIGLLNAIDKSQKADKAKEDVSESSPGNSGKYFRVRVTDLDTGKVRVNLRMPLTVVSAGMKMGMRFAPEIDGLPKDDLQEFIKSGLVGQVVDIIDDEDGEHVEVYIE